MDWSRLISIVIGGIIGWNFNRVRAFLEKRCNLKRAKLEDKRKKRS